MLRRTEVSRDGLTLGERPLDAVSQDDGGSLQVDPVQCCCCGLSGDALTTWTLHEVEDLQRMLCS